MDLQIIRQLTQPTEDREESEESHWGTTSPLQLGLPKEKAREIADCHLFSEQDLHRVTVAASVSQQSWREAAHGLLPHKKQSLKRDNWLLHFFKGAAEKTLALLPIPDPWSPTVSHASYSLQKTILQKCSLSLTTSGAVIMCIHLDGSAVKTQNS